MARIKAIYRGRGIQTPGRGVYQAKQREQWLELLTEPGVQQRTAGCMNNWISYGLCDDKPSRRCWPRAESIEPSSCCERFHNWDPFAAHSLWRPSIRRIDFEREHQLWSYSGLAVVTHMSAEYEMKEGRVVRSRKPIATRGLNRNCNRRMKDVFIGAATGGSQTRALSQYLQGWTR